MKRVFLLFIIMFISLISFGQGIVTKLSENYLSGNAANFWNRLNIDHPQMKAMKNAINKKKPAMQIVANELLAFNSIREEARKAAIKSNGAKDIVNYLYQATAIQTIFPEVEFFIINDMRVNASMYPDGTCIIFAGLIGKAEDIDEVLGVVAHEIAHFVLWHTINDKWRTAKAVRRNQALTQIGTGLAMGVYGASQIHNAQYGVQQSQQAQQQMYENLARTGQSVSNEVTAKTNIYTRLRYMRETEEEADETAFWFMEKNGFDPKHYIGMLKKIDAETPASLRNAKNNTKYSDHPDTPKRIQTMEKLYSKYHHGNVINHKNLLAELRNKAKEIADKESAEEANGILYIDKDGNIHERKDCYLLNYVGFKQRININDIKGIADYCGGCVSDNKKNEIRESLIEISPFTPVIGK